MIDLKKKSSSGPISFSRIWAVLKKEVIQLKRDLVTLRMIIGIPIMQLLIFGFAINSDPRNLPTGVLLKDPSVISRNIIAGLKNSQYFSITRQVHSDQEGEDLLKKGDLTFVVTIPENFTRDLIRGNKPQLLIEADATDPVAVAAPLGSVQTVVDEAIKQDLKAKYFGKKPDYTLSIHRLYNPEGLSHYNVVPGLIAIVLTMTCVMMTAMSLVREKERGTMENLLSMPVKPFEIMMGKVIPYIIIGYVQSLIIIISAYFLLKVPILGSLWLLFLCLFVFIACNLALGFTVSVSAQNQMQASQSASFILLPSILLSGFTFPFLGMPLWARCIGSLLPSTYFVRIVRSIMLKNGTFMDIWPHLWPLCIFMVLILTLATKIYKKTLD